MKEHVVVFAPTADKTEPKLPMVLKDRPDYLKGVLNLPGGKIEPDEDPLQAAVRELKEETGLLGYDDYLWETDYSEIPVGYRCPRIPLVKPELVGGIYGNTVTIHCVKLLVSYLQDIKPREGETEVVQWYDLHTLLREPLLMPNLRVVIPLIQSGLKGWEVIDRRGDWRGDFHTVEVNLPEKLQGWHPLQVTVQGFSHYKGE